MNDYGGVLRNEKGMTTALNRVSEIVTELENSFCSGREYIETLNIATLSTDILKAALNRKGSVAWLAIEDPAHPWPALPGHGSAAPVEAGTLLSERV